jgi:hypothetical protein
MVEDGERRQCWGNPKRSPEMECFRGCDALLLGTPEPGGGLGGGESSPVGFNQASFWLLNGRASKSAILDFLAFRVFIVKSTMR